ncbi:MAG: hypothetical protein A4E72_01592 [Syntrophus sp. PtaU1.Bin208]|nr:MAG: hypothetical protein A4E72_01592 [Syntrophus sp. PtaU1.Bin208]
MDSIPGRADDLRHVRPHAVKPRAGKRPPVSGPGNGHFSVLGLLPEGNEHMGFPVRTVAVQKVLVQGFFQGAPGALLDAPEAVPADGSVGSRHLSRIVFFPLMGFIDADLGAFAAVDAVFTARNPELEQVFQVQGGRFCKNVIFLWHNRSSSL